MLAVVTAWVTRGRARPGWPACAGPWSPPRSTSSNWCYICSTTPTSRGSRRPARSTTSGRWPWRSSSTWSGRGCCCSGVYFLRGRRPGAVRWLALPTLVLAAASAVAMLMLYHPGYDPTQVYEGTDTRACGLLIGAALAMVWPSRRTARTALWSRVVLDGAGLRRAGRGRPDDLADGPVLGVHLPGRAGAAVGGHGRGGGRGRLPRQPGRRALGWTPLRWIGVRSYGIYLWHYPVIILTSPANSTEDLPRAALQVAASIGIAALSWRFVEEPIRHGALERAWKRMRSRTAWQAQSGRGRQLGRGHRRGHGGRPGLRGTERCGARARRQQRGHRHPGRGLGPAAGRRPGPGRLGHERVQHERDQHQAGPRTGGSGAGGSAKGPGSAQAAGRARPAARRSRRPRSAPPARR